MTRTKKSAALLKILVIAAILILLPIVTPNMYIMQIINMIGIYIILGIGINVLTGYTGQLSLGQAAFFGIGAYTAALMNTRAGLQFIPCLLGSVVVTAFFGVVLAIPALKVKGSYLALLTMGFGEVVRIVMINWTPVTNGTAGVLGFLPAHTPAEWARGPLRQRSARCGIPPLRQKIWLYLPHTAPPERRRGPPSRPSFFRCAGPPRGR